MALIFGDSPNRYDIGDCANSEMASGVWSNVPSGVAQDNFQIAAPAFGGHASTKAWFIRADANGRDIRATFTNTAAAEIFFAAAFYLPNLPSGAGRRRIEFSDAGNTLGGYLSFEPSGTIALYNAGGTKIAETASPVISAGAWTWFEFRLVPSAGAAGIVQIRNASGTQVLNVSGLTYGTTFGNIRFRVVFNVAEQDGSYYFDSLSVKDTVGAFQNTWYGGERKNFVINPSADDPASAWTFTGRRMFGPGVGQMTAVPGNNGWRVADAASLELGSGAFTIEGTYRWNALPGAGQSHYLASKWFPSSALSWGLRLYESGGSYFLEFAYTTGGTTGTQVVVHDFPFTPALFTPYAIAVSRNGGTNRLFINGVRQGPAVADAATYHDNAAQVVIGASQLNTTDLANSFNGWVDEFRLTVGVGRYTADYTPATAAFPRSSSDPSWNNVQLLMGWDTASIDESQYGRTVTQNGVATQFTTDDGLFAYQSINKIERDDTFVQAALIAATGTFELTVNPTAGQIITIGAKTYTFRATVPSANDVLIGATPEDTADNLVAAVNAGAGAGTLYGAGTTANADASAADIPGSIVRVEALVPGTGGNSLTFTTNVTGAVISGSGTLTGGQAIPAPGLYILERLPRGITAVESAILFTRRNVQGPGSASITPSLLDGSGAASVGANTSAPANPAWQFDIFSSNGGVAWTTANFVGAKVRVNRTA